MAEKTPAELWGDVAWHLRMIAYGCWAAGGLGLIALVWFLLSLR